MTSANFEASYEATLVYEGGFANNPKDPGGRTMKGVTQRTFDAYLKSKGSPSRDVKSINDTELRDIYRSDYWNKVDGDTLPSGVDMATYDYGVNSGPSRALRDLKAVQVKSPVDTIKALCAKRLSFLHALRTWGTFGKGWTTRVSTVEAKSLKLAGGPVMGPVIVKQAAQEAQKTAEVHKSAAGTATAGGIISSPAVTHAVSTGHIPTMVLVVTGVAIVGLIAFFALKAYHQSTRASVLTQSA